jgi:small subunit ribosomal protein S2
MSDVKIPSMEELLEAGVHFGHTTSRWHPKMEKFLYGKKAGIHLIDLEKTQKEIKKVVGFIKGNITPTKPLLFIGVKPVARAVVKAEADRCESPYVVNRWIGGMLTNWPAIQGMIKRMKQLESDKASGKLEKYTKYEQLEFVEEYNKLENGIGGIRDLTGKPGAVFIIDAKHDKTALNEAVKLNIPVISIADSNINPGKVTYPIPANDDALKSISLITKVIADAVLGTKVNLKEDK